MDIHKPLVALLAIVNPIGVVPFFTHFTQSFTREQRPRATRIIAKVLGRTGIDVMKRLMGLILAAMAVELLADGLGKRFPVLASPIGR